MREDVVGYEVELVSPVLKCRAPLRSEARSRLSEILAIPNRVGVEHHIVDFYSILILDCKIIQRNRKSIS